MSAESHFPLRAEWVCTHAVGLALRHWDDGTVVFDGANSQLQLLSPVAGELLQLLLTHSKATSADLAGRLLGESPTDKDIGMVDNVLEEFSSLNLVHRLPI